jgi:RNA polymerase sigma factor (sigma-70 family)
VYQAEGRASFSTWLTVAARRLCLDHHRSRYGRTRITRDPDKTSALRGLRRRLADSIGADLDTDLLPDAGAASAESETILHERDAWLHAELENLAPQDRLLLALRFEDDLPASEIAGILDLPTPFHVYRRLNAVLARLRVALESHGIDGSTG